MDFYFSPKPNGFKDNVLNVAPDLLPPGSIKIESVMINGENYSDFDAEKLTVQLPPFNERLKVKVTIIPTEGLDHFNISSDIMDNKGKLILGGELDARAIPHLRAEMQNVMQCTELSIDMTNLKILSPEGARAIIFAKQKMNIDEDVTITGATGQVREILNRDEFAEEITLL
jgi:anti-anti-sigma regulatory factor